LELVHVPPDSQRVAAFGKIVAKPAMDETHGAELLTYPREREKRIDLIGVS
jgi:hypothetical protein